MSATPDITHTDIDRIDYYNSEPYLIVTTSNITEDTHFTDAAADKAADLFDAANINYAHPHFTLTPVGNLNPNTHELWIKITI